MPEEKKVTQEATPQATKPVGKPKNCSFCNRVLKRRSWYYRDGKYYCKKKCWAEERTKPLKT